MSQDAERGEREKGKTYQSRVQRTWLQAYPEQRWSWWEQQWLRGSQAGGRQLAEAKAERQVGPALETH